MTFYEILTTYYKDEWNQGLFGFKKGLNDSQPILSFWNVPNIPQPTDQEILSLENNDLELAFNLKNCFDEGFEYIKNLLNQAAKSKGYDNAISISSYANSTNPQWENEAKTFISWRDQVFSYAIDIKNKASSGDIPIPTLEKFISNLPDINWP